MSRRQVLLESITATLEDMQRMLRRVDAETASWHLTPDSWCITDVVTHLAASDELWLQRLQRIVSQDNPFEHAHEPGKGTRASDMLLAEALDAFITQRRAMIAFLSDLTQREWGRPFVHETQGSSRLRDQVQAIVTHDNEHLNQIVELREQRAAATSDQ